MSTVLDMIARGWDNFLARPSGSLNLRFIVQPTIAGLLALRAGIQDARQGRQGYFWAVLSNPKIGADERAVLQYVPAHFKRVLHVRPKMSCRACETNVQAPMPMLPIERGPASPVLLAHVLISKHLDRLPLHRQSDIYVRDGSRSTVPSWRAVSAVWRLLVRHRCSASP